MMGKNQKEDKCIFQGWGHPCVPCSMAHFSACEYSFTPVHRADIRGNLNNNCGTHAMSPTKRGTHGSNKASHHHHTGYPQQQQTWPQTYSVIWLSSEQFWAELVSADQQSWCWSVLIHPDCRQSDQNWSVLSRTAQCLSVLIRTCGGESSTGSCRWELKLNI